MTVRSQHSPAWLTEPSWYLWDGGFLLLGRSEGMIGAHAHHAIQVVIALNGEPAICAEGGNWQSGRGFIVQADVIHSYDGRGADGAMLFVVRNPTKASGCVRASLRR